MGFYRTIVNEMGASEYLAKPLTRDSVQLILRPKLGGSVKRSPAAVMSSPFAVPRAVLGRPASRSIWPCFWQTTKAKVALLDLHLQGGETAVMLGVAGAGATQSAGRPDTGGYLVH